MKNKSSSTQPVRRSLSEGGFFNPRALIGLFVCLAGVLIALSAFGAEPQTDLPESASSGGDRVESLNVDDFINVFDTAADNDVGVNFTNSGFLTTSIRNVSGVLQLRRGDNVGIPILSAVASSLSVGIGTTAPLAPLHVFDPTPVPGSHAIIAQEGDFLLQRTGATAVSFRFANGARVWNFFNGVTGVFQLRDATGGTSPFVLNPGTPSGLLVLNSGGIGITTPTPSSPSTTRAAPG